MLLYFLFVFCIVGVFSVNPDSIDIPLGHGMPLGSHRSSDGHVEEMNDVPRPQDFWEGFAKTRTPVVFRGAAKNFQAFHLWTDYYLRQHFGELEVKLEAKREKDNVPIGEKGLGRDTLGSYLNGYQSKDSYVVSQLPDPMARDIDVLSCLSCGTFATHILEANLWLSSGGTSSMLHRDADNAINCLLNGTKDWILINPQHEDKIPIAKGDEGYGGFAVLDVNNVNLIKYSDFQHVPWQYANISAGDCLFLPYGYWHQVRSYGSKNMAVSVLFSRLKEFNPNGCNKTKYESFPLSNANMVWTYPGHGPQTLGNNDPFELRDMLVRLAQETEERNHIFDSSVLHRSEHDLSILNDNDEAMDKIEMMYQALNNFTNGKITETGIKKLTVQQLKSLAMYIDGDPANTEEYEHVVFSQEGVRKTIEKAIDIDDGRLTENTLIQEYVGIGGSEKIGHEIFAQMDLNRDGVVDNTEASEVLDEVIRLFEKKNTEDDSFNYYMEELAVDREMMEKTHERHDEL